MLADMNLGKTRTEAFQAMRDRLADDEITSIIGAIVQGEMLGTPLANIFRTQADVLRIKRTQRAEMIAGEAGVNMLLPAVLVMALHGADHRWPVLVELLVLWIVTCRWPSRPTVPDASAPASAQQAGGRVRELSAVQGSAVGGEERAVGRDECGRDRGGVGQQRDRSSRGGGTPPMVSPSSVPSSPPIVSPPSGPPIRRTRRRRLLRSRRRRFACRRERRGRSDLCGAGCRFCRRRRSCPRPVVPAPVQKHVARLVTAGAAESTFRLAADGKLPELSLEEAGNQRQETKAKAMNPVMMLVALGVSIIFSVVLVLIARGAVDGFARARKRQRCGRGSKNSTLDRRTSRRRGWSRIRGCCATPAGQQPRRVRGGAEKVCQGDGDARGKSVM